MILLARRVISERALIWFISRDYFADVAVIGDDKLWKSNRDDPFFLWSKILRCPFFSLKCPFAHRKQLDCKTLAQQYHGNHRNGDHNLLDELGSYPAQQPDDARHSTT